MQDQSKQGSGTGSLLDTLSPGRVFTFGIVAGVLVICTVGFFIMAWLYFGGDAPAKKVNTVPSVPTPTAQAPSEPTTITIRDVDSDDHVRGDKNAEITMIEYSDFECPFCSRFTPTVDQVLKEYDGQVKVVYRHFPLRSIHAEAAGAAEASECAAEQGKFWEYHDELFANQSNLGEATYIKIAENLGLNTSKFQTCLDSDKYLSAVQQDEVDAQAAGGRGTPYSVLLGPNGEQVPLSGALPFTSVKPVIDQLLAS